MKSIILVTFIFGFNFLLSQEKLPGRDSNEWKDLTVAQRWQAVNIPQDKLGAMTTDELIEHCVNFDFMWDIFNHRDYSQGLTTVIEHHNGLKELLNRENSGKLILSFYKKVNLEEVTNLDESVNRGDFVAKVFYLELFLSHPNILKQFEGNEKELIKSILKNHDKCLEINARNGKDYYSGYSIGTKALAIGRALNRLKNRETTNPALKNMDLRKLDNNSYHQLIAEARKL